MGPVNALLDLSDARILITGATGNIGSAIARRVSQAGARVALHYRTNAAGAKQLQEELDDLPAAAQTPGPARDRLLQRIMGSPDGYGKQIDGMGGATSSTSKVVIVSASDSNDHDVNYLFGQVAVNQPLIDWSGNCGNLTAAAAAIAIHSGFVDARRIPDNGFATVRIWQQNTGKTIVAKVPIADGMVQEHGDFILDGVAFPSAAIDLEFKHPGNAANALFPSGHLIDELPVSKALNAKGHIEATLINAGIPTVLVRADQIGLSAQELETDINGATERLQWLEDLRVQGALRMGLIDSVEQGLQLQHTPKIVWLAPSTEYRTSDGKRVAAESIDLCARALSMGRLHHAMMASAAVAMASAAVIPGTLVSNVTGSTLEVLRLGHTSGTLTVGAQASQNSNGDWEITQATMQRSARIIMEGWVRVPADCL